MHLSSAAEFFRKMFPSLEASLLIIAQSSSHSFSRRSLRRFIFSKVDLLSRTFSSKQIVIVLNLNSFPRRVVKHKDRFLFSLFFQEMFAFIAFFFHKVNRRKFLIDFFQSFSYIFPLLLYGFEIFSLFILLARKVRLQCFSFIA